jgi:hypothetical protein
LQAFRAVQHGLDIKAVDRTGAIYDVEMQLTTSEGLVERIVF